MAKTKSERQADLAGTEHTDNVAHVDDVVTNDAPESGAKKSIVPSRYGASYKGAQDGLSAFIETQCKVGGEGTDKDEFSFAKFFSVVRKNGVPEDKITPYETGVANKVAGAAGRARMTLRNRLATFARKNGKLIGLDDVEHEVAVKALPARPAKAEAEDTAKAA